MRDTATKLLTDDEGPGPPPGEEHAGAATPPLSLTVVASHAVHSAGTRGGVRVHLLASQQVNVVLQREGGFSCHTARASQGITLTLWPTRAVQLLQLQEI